MYRMRGFRSSSIRQKAMSSKSAANTVDPRADPSSPATQHGYELAGWTSSWSRGAPSLPPWYGDDPHKRSSGRGQSAGSDSFMRNESTWETPSAPMLTP